jgi:ceramide glucosyltransferase
MSMRDYLAHQQRWTRTYRVCRPRGYLAYGITHALVFSLGLGLLSGWASWALGLVAVTLAVRLAVAWVSEYVCLRGKLALPALLLLPLKDLVAFGLWLSSFGGNEVVWQGQRYRLSREGLLAPRD